MRVALNYSITKYAIYRFRFDRSLVKSWLSHLLPAPSSSSACIMSQVPTCAGEMAEWLKAHAWKACLGETLTWVRIPLSPPFSLAAQRITLSFRCNSYTLAFLCDDSLLHTPSVSQSPSPSYGAKYPEISRIKCAGFDANALTEPLVVGTIAMFEVIVHRWHSGWKRKV